MATHSFLYDTMIFVYALSLLFYFSDFASANRRAKRMGTGLLIFVWILQTIFLVTRIGAHPDMLDVTLAEYVYLFAWLLITVSLAMSRFYRIELLVFCVNVIGFSALAVNLFADPRIEAPLDSWQLVRDLLVVHISLVTGAYAALTIAAILSGMYLFLHRQLKVKQWGSTMRRLPSLETIDRYTFGAVLIGIPLFVLSLAMAVTSVLVEGRTELLLDWKVISSLAVLGFYVAYVVRRTVLLQPGQRTAKWNLLSFAVLILNVLLNSASRFHHWT